jgi:serine/threonine protein kinase
MLILITVIIIRTRKKNRQGPSQEGSLPLIHSITQRKNSYQELLAGTNKFNEGNLHGIGSYGRVHKCVLSDGMTVAVKVFNLQVEGAFKSFEAEREIMRNIRHRNLLKIISSCSNTVDFKALVLEYMPNGSLEKWLCVSIANRQEVSETEGISARYLVDSVVIIEYTEPKYLQDS